MARRNIYKHEIDLKSLKIKNAPKNDFVQELMKIPYLGYEVETISDGQKIVIVKPGGKQAYGRIAKEDFFVFIFNPKENSLWQITHKQIYEDLEEKGEINPRATVQIINALERVYNGEEPDDFLPGLSLETITGILPETILKAYKWIWGQEDVNYQGTSFKGRAMSWEGWYKDEDGEWYKTGAGILDIKNRLEKL